MKTELSQVVDALLDRKAVDPVVLDLRGLCEATDYFVIVSGTSNAHVRGMAEHLVATLAPSGVEPHHVEGLAQGRWVMLPSSPQGTSVGQNQVRKDSAGCVGFVG